MRALAAATQLARQPRLEIRRNRVLQALRLIVDLVPLHAKDLRQHALDQVMAQRSALGDLAAGAGQAHATVALHPHKTILAQPTQSHADGGR